MTVIIGYTTKIFSVLATDTRFFVNGRKEDGIIDDYNKLYDLPYPLGWCCGAGFNHVLENFVEKITKEPEIIGVEDFNVVVKTLFDNTKEMYSKFIKDIEKSSLFATWFYGNEKNKGLHSIAYYLKYNSGVSIAPNTYFIDYPYDYSDEMVIELEKKYALRKESKDDLGTALNKIIEIFNEISLKSDGVSRICDIGIQHDNSKELVKQHIKDNIENLIGKFEN